MEMENSYIRAYALAYLLVGEAEGAAQALLETIRLHGWSEPLPWDELAQAALRHADDLSPDRFFLRTLANPTGSAAQVDRLPAQERTALVLHASGLFTAGQIAALIRTPEGALEELLNRAWRQLGEERSALWASLLATVPPMEQSLEQRVEAALAGDDSPSSGRAPRWRLPIGLAFAISLALFFAIRWWPFHAKVAYYDEVIQIEVPAPHPWGSLDLTPYKPSAVIGLSTYANYSYPLSDGMDRAAEKVLQWLGEAKVLGEDPAATPGTGFLSLRFRFADDDLDLWLTAPEACMHQGGPCPVTVGGASKVPLRVEQVDLGRWMAGSGWVMEFNPDAFGLLPSISSYRLRESELALLPGLGIPAGSVAEFPDKKDLLLVFQETNGKWRTGLQPVWTLLIRQPGDPSKGEMAVIDDQTGAVLHRVPVQFQP